MTSTQKKWLKRSLIALFVLGCIALAYWYLKPKPKQPDYITATVEKSSIENSVMATGKVEGLNQVDVGAQVSGEVTKLYVDVGQTVKKGDPIAQIDPLTMKNTLTTQQANLQQSVASLESTKANYATRQASLATAQAELKSKLASLQQAQKEYQRLASLMSMNAVSKQELEQAQTAVKNAEASVESAQSAIKTAKANLVAGEADIANAQADIKKSQTQVSTAQQNLGYTQIVAPMSGTVISITTKQGQTVNANQTAPTIVTLADLSNVRIKAKISEADVINLKAGMPVYFNIIGNPDKKFNATLTAIEPAPEGTTAESKSSSSDSAVYYMGYFDVPNPDGQLRINMTAQVYIVQNKAENVLNVPAAAIKTDPKIGSYVQVLKADNTTAKQAVKTGVTNRINTQIISGLNQGDKVVISEASDNANKSKSNKPPMM
ncbi:MULTISPECIES: efflux RND transporter periplasmic adaptor subunit [unclassified Moraxella]|uniref:efflux RND transporter periplasmic adaptor subunit n=1 Tax=unclassified Moraxella TaxID=2685852 RepID=UPI003AF9FDA8